MPIHFEAVPQPRKRIKYLSLVKGIGRWRSWERAECAFAYATVGGVDALLKEWRSAGLPDDARWLVGIDWYRTQPKALRKLAEREGAEVRIANGREVLGHDACAPTVCFHPKGLVLHGAGSKALLLGSGNLSKSGMTSGHEWGTCLGVSGPASTAEQALEREIDKVARWFETLWKRADPLGDVLEEYERRYAESAHLRSGMPSEDDRPGTPLKRGGRRKVGMEMIRKLRVADSFWIEAGSITRNRGPNKPGNELMMTPMTRVFFGFSTADLKTNSKIGNVMLRYSGVTVERPLRFSHNAMEVLSLPVPGDPGPNSYDQETLLFRRKRDYFELVVGSSAQAQRWRDRSMAVDGLVTMTGGHRAWGVF